MANHSKGLQHPPKSTTWYLPVSSQKPKDSVVLPWCEGLKPALRAVAPALERPLSSKAI